MSTTSDIRSRIRGQIRPVPQIATYPTGWSASLTFEQIAEQLSPHAARYLMHYYTYGNDLADSLQTGLMRLWERLVENPLLLTEYSSKRDAALIVKRLSKKTTLDKQNRKYLPFSVMEGDHEDLDMHETALTSTRKADEWWNAGERWSAFAARIDQHLDIATAIQTIAEEYADDIKGLVALYMLTTEVEAKAAMEAHGLKHSQVYVRMGEIQQKLQALLADYAPVEPKTWLERYHEGEVEPLLKVIEEYRDKPLALKAIDTLTNGAKLRRVATDDKERKMLMYYRKKCSKKIAAAYGQAAAF